MNYSKSFAESKLADCTTNMSEAEWGAKVKGFLENYKFSCVGTWDGFHVCIQEEMYNTTNSY